MTEKPKQSSHLTFEQLLDYLERRLPPAEVSHVEAHLAGDCHACRADLAWLQETLNLMVSDAWVEPPARLRTAARQMFRQERQTNGAIVPALEWFRSLWRPRRRLAVGMAFALTVIVLGAVVAQLLLGQAASQEAQPVAVSGIVELQPAESDSWEPIAKDSSVTVGDQVRTGSDSSLTLRFPDNSVTMLEPNTVVSVVRMSAKPDGSRQVTVLHQDFGQTHNRIESLPSPDSRFQIETPAATITVRGTEFFVDVDLDGVTEVAVVDGMVDVLAQGTTVSLLQGQGTTVFPGEEPAVVADEPTPDPLYEPDEVDIFDEPDEPASGATVTASAEPLDGGTPLPTETGEALTETLTPSPTPSRTPSRTPSPAPSRTPSPTPSLTPSPTPSPPVVLPPTEPPPVEPEPTDPPPTSEPPATSEPVETRKTPPGHTRTPEPPGQTKTPASQGN